jgi:hypothetical protein
MIVMVKDDRRRFIADRIRTLNEELAGIKDDLESCTDRKRRKALTNDAERTLEEIEDFEAKLKALDIVNENHPNVRPTAIESTLRGIDFKKARKFASDLQRTFEDEECSTALLFLQEATELMGYYCLGEILSTLLNCSMQCDLSNQRQIFDMPKDGPYRSYEVDLRKSVAESSSQEAFLKKLIPSEGSLKDDFCASLGSGDRVLILIKNWSYCHDPTGFLTWFVRDFWRSLVSQIQTTVLPKYGQIRVVAVLVAADKLKPAMLSDLEFNASTRNFNPYNPINVPLSKWTVTDIDKWLLQVKRFDKLTSKQEAEQVHRETKGLPRTICSTLMERYSA